jgi:hypothetical protein
MEDFFGSNLALCISFIASIMTILGIKGILNKQSLNEKLDNLHYEKSGFASNHIFARGIKLKNKVLIMSSETKTQSFLELLNLILLLIFMTLISWGFTIGKFTTLDIIGIIGTLILMGLFSYWMIQTIYNITYGKIRFDKNYYLIRKFNKIVPFNFRDKLELNLYKASDENRIYVLLTLNNESNFYRSIFIHEVKYKHPWDEMVQEYLGVLIDSLEMFGFEKIEVNQEQLIQLYSDIEQKTL